MELIVPKEVVPASKMTNTKWVSFRWVNVQTYADIEPMYLCVGVRDITEAKEAEDQFSIWVRAARLNTER